MRVGRRRAVDGSFYIFVNAMYREFFDEFLDDDVRGGPSDPHPPVPQPHRLCLLSDQGVLEEVSVMD